MPSITVKGIPEELFKLLKCRAELDRRSVNSQIIICLEEVLRGHRPNPTAVLARIDALRERLALPTLSDEELKRAKGEGRP